MTQLIMSGMFCCTCIIVAVLAVAGIAIIVGGGDG
jgi:hypothetical protein